MSKLTGRKLCHSNEINWWSLSNKSDVFPGLPTDSPSTLAQITKPLPPSFIPQSYPALQTNLSEISSASHLVSPHKFYLCDLCDTSFSYESSLIRHRNSVHHKNKYMCKICGKGITRRENFIDHMNVHNNVKPYQCPVCAHRFSNKNKLRHHMRVVH